MTVKIVVGIDGSDGESPAVAYAKKLARLIEGSEIIVVYVVEWSPYSFQTPEENAERHRRREQEIDAATTRVVTPVVKALEGEGFAARGLVRHGHVAQLLEEIADEEKAAQIVVARTSGKGLMQRVFGSATAHLVMHASVPVTVVS